MRAWLARLDAMREDLRLAVEDIVADMASDTRMLRLLQGDVGSGKTVVALLAMLNAVEAGSQAALMAPTEILARQHFATIEPLAAAAGVPVVYHCFEGTIHGFLGMGKVLPHAEQAIDRVATALKESFSAAAAA